MSDTTIVALYDDVNAAHRAVDAVVNAGIPREQVGLVANDAGGHMSAHLGNPVLEAEDTRPMPRNEADRGSNIGAIVGGLGGLLVGLGAIAIPGIGPVLAAGAVGAGLLGSTAVTLAGTAAGAAAGGLVGSLIRHGVHKDDAHAYAEGVRRGGTLVTVHAPSDRVDALTKLLEAEHPASLDARVEAWREDGWEGFDHDAPPMTPGNIEAERTRQIPGVQHHDRRRIRHYAGTGTSARFMRVT